MKTAWTRLALLFLCAASPQALGAAEKVSLIKVDGAIGPATADYVLRSLEVARTQNAQCLIIRLNTPGGLLDSTQTIVQALLGSALPSVVYVAPTGAHVDGNLVSAKGWPGLAAFMKECLKVLGTEISHGKTLMAEPSQKAA